MLRYAISNLGMPDTRDQLNSCARRRDQWLRDLTRWAAEGVDFVQLREKSLDAGELFSLSVEGSRLLARIASSGRDGRSPRPKLLINSRPDLAVAAVADGVHLTSRGGELRPEQVLSVFRASRAVVAVFSVSCHTPAEAEAARRSGADLILFGPVFEKSVGGTRITDGTGTTVLGEACAAAAPVPVLALGGLTAHNLAACLEAGASGIAAIRLFARDATAGKAQPGVRK